MGQIFKNAEIVRVCLGDNDRNDAFETIKKTDKAFGIWPEDGHEKWQKWLKSVGPRQLSALLPGMETLRRPYKSPLVLESLGITRNRPCF